MATTSTMPISLGAQLQVREPCGECAGTGDDGKEEPFCFTCFKRWAMAEVDAAMVRGDTLPCGHHKSRLRYTDTACKVCHGDGTITRWLSLREVYQALCQLGDEALDEAEAAPDNDDPGEPIGPYDLYAAQRWEAGYRRAEHARESGV